MNARALLSGFAASAVMSFAFIGAYGISVLLAGISLSQRRGASELTDWFAGLTQNSLIDFSRGNLYVALALHLLAGVLWALLYAHIFEPRLSGPGWRRGLIFSVVPWVLSLIVFFPLVGAGFFGMDLGAGPLPVLGNFILHLIYGATLGLVYGPFGDRLMETSDEAERVALQRSETFAARGVVAGLVAGLALGVVGAIVAAAGDTGGTILGTSPLAFVFASAILGATLGALVGSLAGLPGWTEPEHHQLSTR